MPAKMVYENARRIVGAEVQNIVYGQWLETVLGPFTLFYSGLAISPFRRTSYRSYIDPSIRNEFATAAFRFGHTLIQVITNHARKTLH